MSVVVVVTNEVEAGPLVRMAAQFADARHLRLRIVHPCPEQSDGVRRVSLFDDSDEHLLTAIRAALAAHAAARTTGPAGEGEVHEPEPPEYHVIPQQGAFDGVLAQLKECDADLLIAGKHERLRGEEADYALVRRLYHGAPCDTMLVRLGQGPPARCARILVPSAGGPHAAIALRWGEQVAYGE